MYKQIPVAEPSADEVLVNIKYSGVCHTDLSARKGELPLEMKLPLVGGHEGAGVVVAKGSLVSDIDVGDHVGVKWLNGSRLACEFCRKCEDVSSRPAVGIHCQRHLSAVLYCKGHPCISHTQNRGSGCSGASSLCGDHRLQGAKRVWGTLGPDSRHCRCRQRLGIASAAVCKSNGISSHCRGRGDEKRTLCLDLSAEVRLRQFPIKKRLAREMSTDNMTISMCSGLH